MKMMKKTGITKHILCGALTLMLLFSTGIAAHAAGSASGETVPKDADSYTLTYPDGTVVTENENGEPLTYDDVVRLQKEENWKKIGSGFTSDKNGNAKLPSSWKKGTIKIVETKVPAGYKKGKITEKVVELESGSTTFVNPKIPSGSTPSSDPKTPTGSTPAPAPEADPPSAVTPAAEVTPAPAVANTGDGSHALLYLLLMLFSTAALIATVRLDRS